MENIYLILGIFWEVINICSLTRAIAVSLGLTAISVMIYYFSWIKNHENNEDRADFCEVSLNLLLCFAGIYFLCDGAMSIFYGGGALTGSPFCDLFIKIFRQDGGWGRYVALFSVPFFFVIIFTAKDASEFLDKQKEAGKHKLATFCLSLAFIVLLANCGTFSYVSQRSYEIYKKEYSKEKIENTQTTAQTAVVFLCLKSPDYRLTKNILLI